MKWKEYNYSAEFSLAQNGLVYRPMIFLHLMHEGKSFNCFSLIDSGTDRTIISAEFAESLGIDESKCTKVKIGSVEKINSHGFISKVKYRIEGFDDEFETEVIFLKNMVTSGLLGQKDIFENFKIRFEKRHKKFYLSREEK